ncbi:hypothetical protein [Agarivorans sp. Alg241-V36]|uniref:hypothetical protein n=1 Tax=Agarivorans sp. Alg241-V36 TaxID=2305992 RepID=UPI0013D1304C|nr:hypothetical protein [Agarivorans sp. Alg241-V36]
MNLISKRIIQVILSKPAPMQIPRTGERAKSVDCNVLYVRTKDESWSMLIDSANDKGLSGKKWQGEQTDDIASIDYQELKNSNTYLDITHFYNIYDFKFSSLKAYFFRSILPINKFRVLLDKAGIFAANRKKLVRTERMETLQLILERTIDDMNYKVNAVSMMNLLHSQIWVYHPDRNRQISYNDLLLKSLMKTGELKLVDGSYQITEIALDTLSSHELELKKHKQTLNQAKAITWLTLVLIVVGVIQAFVASKSG